MPDPRLLVDQLHAGLLQRRERRVDVADLVGHVVQARALLREELPHGRVLAERREQLDVVLADVQQHGLDALLLDDLAVGDLHLEAVAPQRERGLDLRHRHADMVDPPEHARQSIGGCEVGCTRTQPNRAGGDVHGGGVRRGRRVPVRRRIPTRADAALTPRRRPPHPRRRPLPWPPPPRAVRIPGRAPGAARPS